VPLLGAVVLAASAAPWWRWSAPASVTFAGSWSAATPWRTSGLWVLAALLGVSAGVVSFRAGRGRLRRPAVAWAVAAVLATLGLALVGWRWGQVPCTCGVSAFGSEDIGWSAYGPGLSMETFIGRPAWGRYVAAAALAAQMVLALAALARSTGSAPRNRAAGA
jgi:hypothetical protein